MLFTSILALCFYYAQLTKSGALPSVGFPPVKVNCNIAILLQLNLNCKLPGGLTALVPPRNYRKISIIE